MEREAVAYARDGKFGIITLQRPERLNAINSSLLEGLKEKMEFAKNDGEAFCIILTGAGSSFCAGEDLKETAAGKSLEQWIAEIDSLQDIQRRILNLDKPLIAAVNGYALGGGCEFAMSCDMRIASENAQFGFPETTVGLTITTAGTKLLSHLVGLGKAKELVFTGDFVDAKEALQIGLVNKVVPESRLLDETKALAAKIASKSPLALKFSRIALDQGLHSSFEQVLQLEASHLLACVGAQNQREFVNRKLGQMGRKE